MRGETSEIASDTLEDAIRSSTIGIVSGSGEQKWLGIGTGTLVRWRGRHLILTAEHVIADTLREDLRFFFPPDSPPIKVARERLLKLSGVPTSRMRPFAEIELGRVVADSDLDLAAIEVDGRLEEKYPGRFFDLAEGGRTPAEGQQTIMIGFPHDISRLTHEDFRVVFTSVVWTQVASIQKHPKDFDPDKHFLAIYTETDTYPDAKPQGISGAAMWFHDDKSVVWSPSLDIAGVAITYFPKDRLMKIVRREAVEKFLTAKAS